MPGKPHSRLSALTVLFFPSDGTAQMLWVKNGVSPLPFAQTVLTLLRLLIITVAGSISCPCCSFFNCRISSWALYSPNLFSYETTRSRNHDNWGQNWPSFSWTTRWSLALSYWMESSPVNWVFQGLTELCTNTAWRMGCTVLPPTPLPGQSHQ